MGKINLKNRFQAFLVHITISVLIAIIIIYICLFHWYPNPLFKAGAKQGLAILLSIDLVLGPLLTLIIFNPLKKYLKWDLAIIALMQISCLSVGLYFVYNEKPDMIVLSTTGVDIISRADRKNFIGEENFKQISQLNSATKNKVPFFVIQTPLENPQSVNIIIAAHELANGKPFELSHENYYQKSEISKPLVSQQIEFINQHFISENEKAKLANLKILYNNHNPIVCNWTVVRSNHFDGFACVNNMQGIVKLIKKDNKNLNHVIY